MTEYVNKGGPWRRPDGKVIPFGATFTPTTRELERMHLRRQIGTRFVAVGEAAPVHLEAPAAQTVTSAAAPVTATPTLPEVVEATVEESVEAQEPEWPLRMTPERYVQLHPEGPHAEAARAILAAR